MAVACIHHDNALVGAACLNTLGLGNGYGFLQRYIPGNVCRVSYRDFRRDSIVFVSSDINSCSLDAEFPIDVRRAIGISVVSSINMCLLVGHSSRRPRCNPGAAIRGSPLPRMVRTSW